MAQPSTCAKRFEWPRRYTASVPQHLPTTPGTGLCHCGAAYFYAHGKRVGDAGHFHCRRCVRRYSIGMGWTPGGVGLAVPETEARSCWFPKPMDPRELSFSEPFPPPG